MSDETLSSFDMQMLAEGALTHQLEQTAGTELGTMDTAWKAWLQSKLNHYSGVRSNEAISVLGIENYEHIMFLTDLCTTPEGTIDEKRRDEILKKMSPTALRSTQGLGEKLVFVATTDFLRRCEPLGDNVPPIARQAFVMRSVSRAMEKIKQPRKE